MSGPEKEESLERFFARLQPILRSTLARYSIPAADAEALLEDVLLTLVYKRDSISAPERWLLQTVRHRCLNFWRRRRWQLYSHLDAALLESVADPANGNAFSRELDSIVGSLPVSCKGLLRQRYGLAEGEASSAVDPSKLEKCIASLGHRLAERGVLDPSSGESS